ncbi:MAG: 50S ribosomal protein L27 [Microgenomates group bacterium GW2011_GWF2_45_18]|nr:MAG: 50S ribosomal protein L27 [Microgenomates group bacterium GW2011_GWF1_44_10]KKU02370.1 MAG: 50S ribosomal protein L27 [Microgenomates group bacterium GW2011_GWF2_45_18]OGJ41702.1 MAG: 50S ribosomal protein L27 [Candidatus Pacebacteria bacterium RIFOXYB1_FULL_44_10]HAU99163.1 50S ribosomal protein L27 [Candidatus Paceibacterota bacterium]HAX01693.1 50S ribosomal protein L27 [Candidatus Paceibacterota bacterium]
MAHVKSGGATRQSAPRPGKRLGVKKFGSEQIKVGQIILRQKGLVYKPGKNVAVGRDNTIYSMIDGIVTFGKKLGKTLVSVLPKTS